MPEVTDPDGPQPSTGVPRRWPARVYAVGQEPDPRFTLANERTFLAWIRTSLGLLVAGLAVEVLQIPVDDGMRKGVAITAVMLGLLTAVSAFPRWMASERAMRLAGPLPAMRGGASLSLAIAVLCAVAVVVLL